MKIQLVILPSGPILVSDEPINDADWVMDGEWAEAWQIQIQKNTDISKYKKVIAGIEGMPTIVMSREAAIQFSFTHYLYDVEVEMEDLCDYEGEELWEITPDFRPKIINNTIKVTKIL